MFKLDQINKILFNKLLINIHNNDIYYKKENIVSNIKSINNNNLYLLLKKIINFLNFYFRSISIKIYFKLFINNNYIYSLIFNNKSINNNIYIANNKFMKIFNNNNKLITYSNITKFKSILIRNKLILDSFEETKKNKRIIFKKMSIFKFFNKNILFKKYIYNKYLIKNHKNYINLNINKIFRSKFKILFVKKSKSIKKKILYLSNIKRKLFSNTKKSFYKLNKSPLYYKDLAKYKKFLVKKKIKFKSKHFKKKYILWTDLYYKKNIALYFINNNFNFINNTKLKISLNFLEKKLRLKKSKFNKINNNGFYSMFIILLNNRVLKKANSKFIYLKLLEKNNIVLSLYINYLNLIYNRLVMKKYKNWFNKKYLYFINTSKIFIYNKYKKIIINNLNTNNNTNFFLNNNKNIIKFNYNNKKNSFFYYYLKLIIFNNIITKNYKYKQRILGVSNFFNKSSRLINLFYKILYNINIHNLEENNYYKLLTYKLGYNTQNNNIIDSTDIIRFSSYFNGYNDEHNSLLKKNNNKIDYKKELNYYINTLKDNNLSESYIFMINAYRDLNINNLYFKLLSKQNLKLKKKQDIYSYYNYMNWLEYNLNDLRSLKKDKSYISRKVIIEYDICIKPSLLKLIKLMEEAAKKKKKSVWRIFLEQFRVDNRIILKKNYIKC